MQVKSEERAFAGAAPDLHIIPI